MQAKGASPELTRYPEAFTNSWLYDELHRARNFKPWMSKGLYTGTIMVGIDQILFRGKAPWTLHHKHADNETLKKKTEVEPISLPRPDGVLTFEYDVIGVHLEHQSCGKPASTSQAERPFSADQCEFWRSTMRLNSATVPPGSTRSCATTTDSDPRLQINFQNCVHCKTCDIKDPTENILVDGAGRGRRTEQSQTCRAEALPKARKLGSLISMLIIFLVVYDDVV